MVRTFIKNTVNKFTGLFSRTNPGFMSTFNAIMDMSDETVLKPYERSVWVYACIKKISDNVSKTPYIVSKTAPSSGKTKILDEDDALVKRLMQPNPYMIDMELLDHTLSWLQYRGEVFWMLDRESMYDIPDGIYVFDPRYMEPVFDEGRKKILGWYYYTQEKKIFFTEKNIIHFKSFNPNTPVRGFSATVPAQNSIDQEYLSGIYNKAFFRNGGAVSGWLFVKEELSDEAYKRLLKSFESRHRGARKGHRVGVLEGGTDFKPSNLSHKDMDFANLKGATKKEILVAYMVSEVVLGEYTAIKSYEGINAAHRTFWHECLLPKIKYLERVINLKFLKNIDSRLSFKFDLSMIEALKDDLRFKMEMTTLMLNMGYTPNQINKRLDLNMPENAWGDYAYLKKGRLPIKSEEDLEGLWEQLSSGNSNNGSEGDDGEESDDDNNKSAGGQFTLLEASVKDYAAKQALNKVRLQKELQQKRDIAVQTIQKAKELEKTFTGRLRRCFFEKRKLAIINLYNGQDTVSDEPLFKKRISSICEDIYTELLTLGKTSVQEELDTDLVLDLNQPEDEDLLKSWLERTPKQLVEPLYEQMRKLSEAEELSQEECIQKHKSLFNNILNYSLYAISRLECVRSLNEARIAEMRLQGVQKHRFITLENENPVYKGIDGQVSKIGKYFSCKDSGKSVCRFPGDLSKVAIEEGLDWSCTVPYTE